MISQTISHYRIISKLGAGGMGEVYLAEDTKLGRKVALKLLPTELVADEQAKKRLIREAQTAATLDHPNICAIHEVNEEEGQSFIVMQYVQGETLSDRIQKKPLELRKALDVAVQVADALVEAHSRGIIHRDIKPQNIMITPRDQAKVMDFGLAKMSRAQEPAASNAETETLMTEPGLIVGTLPYLSPEQFRGEALDARSDIFSFGAVLYEMVTGHRPFAAGSAPGTISALLTQDPPPLTRYADVPAELQRIVRKCLEKDRERRYQSTRDLLVDLRTLKSSVESDVVGAGGAVSGRQTSRKWIYAAVLLALLGFLGAAALYLFNRKSQPMNKETSLVRSIAVLPFKPLVADQRDESLQMGMADTLIVKLSNLKEITVRPISSVRKFSGLEQDPVAAGRELGVESVLDGEIQRRGDQIRVTARVISVGDGKQLWADQFDVKFSDVFTVQDLISEKVISGLALRLSGEEQRLLTRHYTENAEAYQLYVNGRFYWVKRTHEALQKAIEYFEQAISKDPNYALAYAGLADSYALLGVFHLPPKEAFPKAKDAALKALRLDDRLAEAHAALGHVKVQYDYDWAGAEKEYKRAIALNPSYANAHHFYSFRLTMMGRFDEGMAEIKRAQELEPSSPFIQAGIGVILYWGRRYDEAINQLHRVLEMNPNLDFARSWLGFVYLQKGMYQQAIDQFQKRTTLLPGNLGDLGQAYGFSGRKSEALEEMEKLRELSRRRYVPPYNLALIYASLGDKDNALEWLEKSYEDRSTLLIWIRVDPRLDKLRSEPGFKAIIKRMGLE